METVKATTINDLWHQALYLCWEKGYDYKIDSGSYAGQIRRQFDFFAGEITHPETRPLSIVFPEGLDVPSPNNEEQINQYAVDYLLSPTISKNETYTYGSRMIASSVNQVAWAIEHFKKYSGNNHCCLTIPVAEDLNSTHAPCLRLVDLKIVTGKLNLTLYFRSWDLWSGLPTNLGGFQIFNEYVAQEIGIPTGKLFCSSAGLHLYEMYFDVVKKRLRK